MRFQKWSTLSQRLGGEGGMLSDQFQNLFAPGLTESNGRAFRAQDLETLWYRREVR